MNKPQNLEEFINVSGIKKGHLANKLGVSRQTFRTKLQNPKEFTVSQADILCKELGIVDAKDKVRLFFML